MSFGTTGFGGAQLYPQPQVFQALSVGGVAPIAPVRPYGTPNPNLVPVHRTGNPSVPANLSLAAAPVFSAILKINPAIVGISNPPVGGAPNTTSGIGATNPAVTNALVGSSSGSSPAQVPQGPVSFALTTAPAYVTSALDIVEQSPPPPQATQQTQKPETQVQSQSLSQAAQQAPAAPAQPVLTSAPSIPPSKSPQYVVPVDGALVQRIVQTVTQLTVSAVYPAPVFSFSA